MEEKPEISYDRDNNQFLLDGQPIDDAVALDHWNAVDADWTVGAYEEMVTWRGEPEPNPEL